MRGSCNMTLHKVKYRKAGKAFNISMSLLAINGQNSNVALILQSNPDSTIRP